MNNLFFGEILVRLRWGRGELNGSIVKGDWKILSLTEAVLLCFIWGGGFSVSYLSEFF